MPLFEVWMTHEIASSYAVTLNGVLLLMEVFFITIFLLRKYFAVDAFEF